ncbi:MAG: DUF5712 family protein [Tannerella sp.]|jgi:hypothetical protein|nr:DUF5712 family protein [Tannerella sp.]
MNIDFPPPSNGVYNNAGSSRQLVNYMEHEDMERMEQGIYTESFFNLTDNNIYKSQIITDIDGNIGQLLKTDAKFYAIHVSPSEKELRAMGTTEQEQAEAMKWYIRTVFIPEYAKNFNKGLSAEDIKFYGKIHFNRDRSNNELNMHCHLIVSRKDQSNKVKISPLTNHRNTKKGAIKGGFNRTTLFENAEKGFDKLFGYNRQLQETFEYCNTMKNGSITDQLKMQERELNSPAIHSITEKKDAVDTTIHQQISTSINQSSDKAVNQPSDLLGSGLGSVFSIFSPEPSNLNEEQPIKLPQKKKKRQRRIG